MSELLIKVAITYKGDKARSLVPGYTSQADVVTTLRTDLTRLKSLHPKTETIQLHSAGHITCSWKVQDHNPITKKLRQIDREQNSDLYQRIKDELFIDRLVITEEPILPDHRPFFSHRNIDYRIRTHPFQHNNGLPARRMSSPHIANFATGVGNPREEQPGGSSFSSNPFTFGASEVQTDARNGQTGPTLPSMAQGFFPDTADIEQLTHALWKIRDQIAAAKTVENNLLDRLKRLGAPAITESHMEVDDQDMGNSPTQLQMALEMERKRRIEAEQALQDVERECKEPFVVPALLKAFINISKLTSES